MFHIRKKLYDIFNKWNICILNQITRYVWSLYLDTTKLLESRNSISNTTALETQCYRRCNIMIAIAKQI